VNIVFSKHTKTRTKKLAMVHCVHLCFYFVSLRTGGEPCLQINNRMLFIKLDFHLSGGVLSRDVIGPKVGIPGGHRINGYD